MAVQIKGLVLLMACVLAGGSHAGALSGMATAVSATQAELSSEEEQDRLLIGRSFFTVPWVAAPSATTARDGLGPLFNSNTCASCHQAKVAGHLLNDKHEQSRALVVKLSQPQKHALRDKTTITVPDPVYGSQIAINGVSGVLYEATPGLDMQVKTVVFPDGTEVGLSWPVPYLKRLNYGPLSPDTRLSLRLAPMLNGTGLIEQIPEQAILAGADPNDRNRDGISGKANWVYDPLLQAFKLGRFGHKASQASVMMQTADAAAHDMGLTNPYFPEELCGSTQTACLQAPAGRPSARGETLDLPMHRLEAISFYVNHLNGSPKRRSDVLPQALAAGKALFQAVGCVQCHRPSFKTQKGQTIYPYSDFLLHDLGPALADARPEFDAQPNEWRTAPLWGSAEKVRQGWRFLHDGRAANHLEAILWHDAEAAASRQAFMQLNATEREQLIQFLESL